MIKHNSLIIIFILLVSFVLYSFIKNYLDSKDPIIEKAQKIESISNKYADDKLRLENALANSKADEEKRTIEQDLLKLQKQLHSDMRKIFIEE